MLALDPPLDAATRRRSAACIATNDSGPLRHRYGGVRDLVVGITVVLSDGTVAKAGGKVIKNVAGYDLAKLFTGSFGTLGLIASGSRCGCTPRRRTATAHGATDDPDRLAAAAIAARRAARWRPTASTSPGTDGSGRLLVRFGGSTAAERARDDGRWSSRPCRSTEDDDDALGAPARAPALATAPC